MTRLTLQSATEFFKDTFRGVPYDEQPSSLLATVWFWQFQFCPVE